MTAKKQAKAESIQAHYERLVAQGSIKHDDAQRQVLAALAALQAQLTQASPSSSGERSEIRGSIARLTQAVKWIPGSAFGSPKMTAVRGMYIWGNVGRGKSMLMDLFFEHVPLKKKRRIHFHAFMQEIHTRIHRLRQEKQDDPVAVLARQLADETTLLCFDELQANDVADATLLYRLFSGLFDAGVIIVSTSNHPPATLYTGGHQRERFAKFIELIEERMQVMALSSAEDYRQMQARSLQKTYFYPLGPAADVFIDNILQRLGAGEPHRETLSVQGRNTFFTLYNKTIGRFTFHQLCESTLGPADYLALAKRLNTLILTDIPRLPPEKRNEAKRFVTLIDALYEHKVKLIATAAAAAEQLYPEGDGAFEFKRTVSRLAEMQSEKYLQK